MSKVLLAYQREEGDTCRGYLQVDAVEQFRFSGTPFRRMLTHLAKVISQVDAKEVTFQRTDREGLFPLHLEETTVALAKSDPTAFVQSFCYGYEQPTVVNLGKVREAMERGEKVVPRVQGVLTAGVDTLADSMGELVYLRTDSRGFVECPLCGRWHDPEAGLLYCPTEGNRLPLDWAHPWVMTPLRTLLPLNHRFYLPREWNPSRGWISKEDLQQLYESYLKEKATYDLQSR